MEQLVNVEDPDPGVTGKQEENLSTLSANGMLHHGLHYIDLASLRDSKVPVVEYGKGEPMKMTALHPDFKTSPEIQESIGHANRSAHIWGVGLWEACKESRDVIATHFQLKLWGGIQDEGLGPLDVDESLSKACQLYPRYVKFLSDTEG
ncbi:hypothetical protein FOXYSP1_18528 [Fusarium oxysporum f. sp. phaseoli]